MPGVNRPYTLVDVLMTIYDQTGATSQSQGGTQGAPSITGVVIEVDETATVADSAVAVSAANRGWDQEVWGGIAWT